VFDVPYVYSTVLEDDIERLPPVTSGTPTDTLNSEDTVMPEVCENVVVAETDLVKL
jgi:hypothetical protein